jgi:hypothetical protein
MATKMQLIITITVDIVSEFLAAPLVVELVAGGGEFPVVVCPSAVLVVPVENGTVALVALATELVAVPLAAGPTKKKLPAIGLPNFI